MFGTSKRAEWCVPLRRNLNNDVSLRSQPVPMKCRGEVHSLRTRGRRCGRPRISLLRRASPSHVWSGTYCPAVGIPDAVLMG